MTHSLHPPLSNDLSVLVMPARTSVVVNGFNASLRLSDLPP